jgi:hypothetical protein
MDYGAYAIWWVPRPGTGLAQFGAEWTGWCADRGIVSAGASGGAATGGGRGGRPVLRRPVLRRGLHASLSSPFRLAADRSAWALEDALADLAVRTEAVRLPPLELTVFDGRVALVLARPECAVARLVAAVGDTVRPFALPLPFAAPDGGAGPEGCGREGCAVPSLDRFHLPLTGRLDLGRCYEVVAELGAMLAPVLARRHRIADLALVGDPGGGRPWRLLQRHVLAGETAHRDRAIPAGMSWRGPSLLAPLAGAPGHRRATA